MLSVLAFQRLVRKVRPDIVHVHMVKWAIVSRLCSFLNRYATDEKAGEALYWTGKADLDDGRPASALGEWNRLLKLFPRSPMLDRTLFGMGEAYETMHDCANAKLAYGTVISHFPKGKLATEARARTATVNALPAGSCAPP